MKLTKIRGLLQFLKQATDARTIIISLYDYSGIWSAPYRKAGYRVLQVESKLGFDVFNWNYQIIPPELVAGILAAPPCTDFAVSGAQYWKQKDKRGQTRESLRLVKRTLEIVEHFQPSFWAMENPVGRLNKLLPELEQFGPWYFEPYWYGDPWSKKTGLWGKFNKPKPDKIVKPVRFTNQGSWTQLLGGKSERTKELRSITPPGFARAFYKANPIQT
ncbi:MAG: hypothetical protein ACK4E0_03355 [Chitinophagaceae bacterium]